MRKPVAQIFMFAVVLASLFAPTAQAGEVVFAPQNNPPDKEDGWQAGTCATPTCAPDSESFEFYETAAGHPPFGITQFIVKHKTELLHKEPEVNMKTLRVDLPVGLSVNPGATPQCEAERPKDCPLNTKVGESVVIVSPEIPLLGPPIPVVAPVYNLKPKFGQPARFGFTVEAIPGIPIVPPSDIYLEADVAWESDFHEGFTIQVPKVPAVKLLQNRLIFNGRASASGGTGYFLTTPSTCFDPTQPATEHTYSTYARADSLENPDPSFPNGSPFVESKLPPGTSPKDCATIPFDPSIAVDPGTSQVDSPAGAVTEVKLPVEPNAAGQETSTMRTARVTLPAGMGLNPSAANGLAACTDAQFGKGTRNPVTCPPASKVGTVTVATPPLPEGPLTGNVYVGEQKSRNPESGEEYRILVHAFSARYGVDLRLVGNVIANAKTGQLTAVFDDPPKNVLRGGNSDNLPNGLPQVPFTSFKIDIDDGPKAALSSPPICGPNTTNTQLTPWSAQFSGKGPATPSSNFSLASLPGGGPCPKTMAQRPFAPGFNAKPQSEQAKTFTPFSTNITRPPGQQELKGIDLLLPPGATAKLKGVPYCPPKAIAGAEQRGGAAERKNASCPNESRIGVAKVQAGTGPSPLAIEGDAYLAGPYKGAPLSIAVVTPAIAGPFDLGNVVVRVPLFLASETARIHPRTFDIPDVFGGTKLDIRSIFLNINRKDFTLNGTNCRKGETNGAIYGGGANPLNPNAYAPFKVAEPFQAQGCRKLKFRPKLNVRLFGKTQRSKHPKLRAVLKARGKDANIRRAVVALPRALFLDQASLGTVCTRVQFAEDKCPKRSVYGRAKAFTPLLGKPLKGKVYLRSSNNTLPD
ncbi:MAG: hypothetical protein M3Y75_04980, partial [Actinomycetota bacterium]|nr:hypothetical protein [Actinomycetota bacterium]